MYKLQLVMMSTNAYGQFLHSFKWKMLKGAKDFRGDSRGIHPKRRYLVGEGPKAGKAYIGS